MDHMKLWYKIGNIWIWLWFKPKLWIWLKTSTQVFGTLYKNFKLWILLLWMFQSLPQILFLSFPFHLHFPFLYFWCVCMSFFEVKWHGVKKSRTTSWLDLDCFYNPVDSIQTCNIQLASITHLNLTIILVFQDLLILLLLFSF